MEKNRFSEEHAQYEQVFFSITFVYTYKHICVYLQREKSKRIDNEIISESLLSSGTGCTYAVQLTIL